MKPDDVIGGRFELVELAGSGGMGAVYRARDRHTASDVAVKVLSRPEHDLAERFAREARLLAELSHPAIVRYVAHGETPAGEPYLVMEWLEGEDLGRRLRTGRCTLGESLVLAERLAGALAAAHARGVVHRDVKPANVFLPDGRTDRLKLLDFGVARLRNATHAVTESGARVGTPRYMAPEQVLGAPDVDARADVFALGCVLFACLTGQAAFAGEEEAAVLAKILLAEAPRVGELTAGIPPPLDDLVARMLSKDREARPADGAAVAAELAALGLRGDETSAPRPRSLPAREQRLISVILVGPPAEAGPLQGTVRSYGGELARLIDGSVVVTLAGTAPATDQAARGARLALALRDALPDAQMALVTGHGMASARLPVGEALDRGAALLRTAPAWKLAAEGVGGPRTSSARPGGRRGLAAALLIDTQTAGLIGDAFAIAQEDGQLVLEGEREPLQAARPLLGKPTRFVGREPELGLLAMTFDACVEDPSARAVVLVGAAGMGKSRLRAELLHRLAQRGQPPLVLVGHGDPMRAGSPFAVIASALRREVGLQDGLAPAAAEERLRGRVARHVRAEDQPRTTEFLGELVGVRLPDEARTQLRAARESPSVMGAQIQRAWEDWLAAECAAQPVLIVLEDLHWGDVPTVELIDATLRNLADRPLMVLAVARPEVAELFPSLWAKRGAAEVSLGKLPPRAAERLVRQALPDASAAAVTALIERADGNALFLEELVRAVARGDDETLPHAVVALLQHRLHGLPPEARRLLRAASVFGDAFARGGVAALLADLSALELDEWLAHLVAAEVIARRGASRSPHPSDEYVFHHALVREAAYSMLTDADRALGHLLAGEWLERIGERDAALLAEQFARGRDPVRALGWYRRAAEQALDANDYQAVLVRAGRAIGCGAEGSLLGELRLLQAEALFRRGNLVDMGPAALEARALLPRGTPSWYRATDRAIRLKPLELPRVLALIDELCDEGRKGPGDRSFVMAAASAVGTLFYAEEPERARGLLAELEPHATVDSDPAARAILAYARAWDALSRGDHLAAIRHSSEHVRSCEQAGDVRGACLARTNLADECIQIGDYARAEELLREAARTADRHGIGGVAAGARASLGLTLANLGRLDEARTIGARAVDEVREQGNAREEAMARNYLARVLVAAGDLPGAHAQAEAALSLVPPLSWHAALSLATLAETGGEADAQELAQRAADVLASLGSLLEGEAHVRLVHARALHAAGETGRAHEAIAKARDRLLGLADRLGDPAARQSFLERVPENAATLALARAWLG